MTTRQVGDDADGLDRRRLHRLMTFGDDWGRGDLDALMVHLTDDCVYVASVGPEPGATFIGRDAVRQGFQRLLAFDASTHSHTDGIHVAGDWGIVLWRLTRPDGRAETLVTRGCDIFLFRGDRIARKDAYRKVAG